DRVPRRSARCVPANHGLHRPRTDRRGGASLVANENQNSGDKGQNPGGDESQRQQQQNQSVALDWLPEADTIDISEGGKTVTTPLRGVKTLTKFKTPSDLARGYVNLERYAGGAIRIPGADAKPDEVATFREKLGVPKDSAGYGIKYEELKVPE